MDVVDVVVVGLGFTGLPTAVAAAGAGARVVGVDSSAERVRELLAIRRGCGLGTVSEDVLQTVLADGRLVVRDAAAGVPAAGVHVLCLPTPADQRGGADLRPLTSACNAVGRVLRRGDLVLVQSTCPPGTVDRSLVPVLERGAGLRAGADFHVACAPMRLDPGNELYAFRSLPRVVGGYTRRCAQRATRFLSVMTDEVVEVATTCAAELTKIFENTFRLVNISLANELGAVCRAYGLDVAEVLRAAGTKPFGFLRHQPSAGAGGDCVPVSARFFAAAARRRGMLSPLVDSAIAVNEAMPVHTVHRLREALHADGKSLRGARILVLGVTYKPDTPNVRQSASVAVLEELRREAAVEYHDPYVPELVLSDGVRLASTEFRTVQNVDLVVVMTAHEVFRDLPDLGVPIYDCSSGEPTPGVAASRAAA